MSAWEGRGHRGLEGPSPVTGHPRPLTSHSTLAGAQATACSAFGTAVLGVSSRPC